MSDLAEVFFYRLIVNCDDYGRADARPSVLLAKCFPLRGDEMHPRRLTAGQVGGLLEELRAAGLITLYRNGREYLQLKRWEGHQSVRSKRSKHPGPDDPGSELVPEIICKQMQADASRCMQMFPVSNPIQSVSNPNPNPNPNPISEEDRERGQAGKGGTNPDGPSPTALTWRAYRDAYHDKYGKPPVWNAKVGGQLKSFVSRVPVEHAPAVAAFYLNHIDRRYVGNRHPVGLLLQDAERLFSEWDTGSQMTATRAGQIDQAHTAMNAFDALLVEAEKSERGRNGER